MTLPLLLFALSVSLLALIVVLIRRDQLPLGSSLFWVGFTLFFAALTTYWLLGLGEDLAGVSDWVLALPALVLLGGKALHADLVLARLSGEVRQLSQQFALLATANKKNKGEEDDLDP
ncbi:MAG: DUF2304 family protein [Casimicrobiaceae bacterium]|nr:DUF2304 family protein [Casimicrobiaceae bacterium]MDW8311554.1 DUF2304 family protein [Burkholderiales bacterium]